MTKGMKIINNIARTFKRPNELDDIVRASNDARVVGGSFTANDVADMLRWAFNVAIDATGNRDALRRLEEHYKELCANNRKICRKELEEAFERAERAERVASEEYERARDEFGQRAEEAEKMLEEFQDDAEELKNMKNVIGEDLWEALAEMVPEDRRLPQDTAELVETVSRCGKSIHFGQYAMAV